MAVSNKDGVKFFPAFTDWLEFLKWKNDPDADTMVITFDQYCGILLEAGCRCQRYRHQSGRNQHRDPQGKNGRDEGRFSGGRTAAGSSEEEQHSPAVWLRKGHQSGSDRCRRPSASENNEPARNNMFEAMRKARFVAPVLMEVPKEVKAGEKVNAQAEFIMLNHEGGKYMPLFTSLSELQKWNGAPDCKAVPMSMANYVAMLSDPKSTAAGIVLDPFTMGLAFSKEQAMNIQPRLAMRDIDSTPEGMEDDLKAYFAEKCRCQESIHRWCQGEQHRRFRGSSGTGKRKQCP